MHLARGDSGETLIRSDVKNWLRGLDKKVKLFVSDRPFNILKKRDGAPMSFDNMKEDCAVQIAKAEALIAHTNARFLSRVSYKSEIQWRNAYKKQNLFEQPSVFVTRDG